jgi:hypothetical protein
MKRHEKEIAFIEQCVFVKYFGEIADDEVDIFTMYTLKKPLDSFIPLKAKTVLIDPDEVVIQFRGSFYMITVPKHEFEFYDFMTEMVENTKHEMKDHMMAAFN